MLFVIVPTGLLKKFFEKGAWPGSCAPVNFWVLCAPKRLKLWSTDFKFVSVPMKHIKEIEYGELRSHVTDDVP